MPDRFFLFYCLSFCFGILISAFQAWLLIIVFLFLLVYFLRRFKKKNLFSFKIAIWCFLFFIFGIIRFLFSFPVVNPQTIQYYNGSQITTIGYVCSDPERNSKKQSFNFCAEKIIINSQEKKVSGKILVNTFSNPEYYYGQVLVLEGELEKPKKINSFNYDLYLSRFNIYSLISFPKIKLTGEKSGFKVKILKSIYNFRHVLQNIMSSGLPELEGGLASSLLLGYRDTPKDLQSDFSRSGLSHVIAISGTHITILIGLLETIFLSLGLAKRKIFFLSVALIVFYIILSGLQASALRAGLMGFLMLLAWQNYRLPDSENIIFFSAAVLLLFNPRFYYDLGFILSYLAILALLYINPIIITFLERFYFYQKIKKRKFKKAIIDIIVTTFAVQIAALPLLINSFNQISLIAPLSNILVLWTFPFIMAFMFIALPLSALFSFLTKIIFFPVLFFLKYLITTAHFLASFPGAVITMTMWPQIAIMIYYFILIYVIISRKVKEGSVL